MANSKHISTYSGAVEAAFVSEEWGDVVAVGDLDVLMVMNSLDTDVELGIPSMTDGVKGISSVLLLAGLGFALDLTTNQKKIPGGMVSVRRAPSTVLPTSGKLSIVGIG